MARPAAPSPRRTSPDHRFRGPILAAIAEGRAPKDMKLRLTLQDVSLLMRDHSVPLADVSYVGGVMHFLGVPVEKGGVPTSVLDLGAD